MELLPANNESRQPNNGITMEIGRGKKTEEMRSREPDPQAAP
jgi:hypothetical protein